jgi:hypothetical protein
MGSSLEAVGRGALGVLLGFCDIRFAYLGKHFFGLGRSSG